jgi:hypothetical protein
VTPLLPAATLASAAASLHVSPRAGRALELITRAIHAAGPDGFERAGLALDGSTALIGVYLAMGGERPVVLRALDTLEVAPVRAGADIDGFRAAIANALGATIEGEMLVFPPLEGLDRNRLETPRLPVRVASSPLTFDPPAGTERQSGARTGAITADGIRFRIHPTANPPAAVPTAYLEELVYRLVLRLAVPAGSADAAAVDDFAWFVERDPVLALDIVGGPVRTALARSLAARGLNPTEALPAIRGRILYALRAGDRSLAAAPGWRLDGAPRPADRLAIEQAAIAALRPFEETR